MQWVYGGLATAILVCACASDELGRNGDRGSLDDGGAGRITQTGGSGGVHSGGRGPVSDGGVRSTDGGMRSTDGGARGGGGGTNGSKDAAPPPIDARRDDAGQQCPPAAAPGTSPVASAAQCNCDIFGYDCAARADLFCPPELPCPITLGALRYALGSCSARASYAGRVHEHLEYSECQGGLTLVEFSRLSLTFLGDELVAGHGYVTAALTDDKVCQTFGNRELGVDLLPPHDVGTLEVRECRRCEGGTVLFEPLPAPGERCGVDVAGRLSLPGPGVTPVEITAVERDGGIPPEPPELDGSIDAASFSHDSS